MIHWGNKWDWELGTGKLYLRVYIQIRFRHACHETRDRQSRSLVSGQEEGWGGGGGGGGI